MNRRDVAFKKEVLSLFGDNVVLRRRLQQRLSHRELQQAVMLGTQHMVGPWCQFIGLMERMATLLVETTAEAQELLESLKTAGVAYDMGNTANEAPGGLPKLEQAAAAETTPATITFEEFLKVDMRVGKILTCERVPKSKKLVKMDVDFGSEIGKRVILAGIADHPEFLIDPLINLHAIFVVNLAPREILKGHTSHGMLLSAKGVTGLFCPVTCGSAGSPAPGSKVG